jgi:histidinol-phosphate aminotransferase
VLLFHIPGERPGCGNAGVPSHAVCSTDNFPLENPRTIVSRSPMPLPVRNAIHQLAGYTPGEQPQESGWVKLNTNENPSPPSPLVVEAIQRAASGRLNVYPDALATPFRHAVAELFNIGPDWILPANGSDENLTIIVRTACDSGQLIAYPYPSYVLYEALARIQGCRVERLALDDSFAWSPAAAAELRCRTRVFFVPNPNSPTGNVWPADSLVQLLPDDGLLVLDEAYVDFADIPHRGELLQDGRFDRRLVITRTLSKSYSLAGIRFGFSIAHPDLTAQLQKAKDSYNCDAVAMAAATAAIRDQDWMLSNRAKILATRARLSDRLRDLGFKVYDSQTNFVWIQHASSQHQTIYLRLKERHILVRYMKFPGAGSAGRPLDGLRITIGTDDEIDQLLHELTECIGDL